MKRTMIRVSTNLGNFRQNTTDSFMIEYFGLELDLIYFSLVLFLPRFSVQAVKLQSILGVLRDGGTECAGVTIGPL